MKIKLREIILDIWDVVGGFITGISFMSDSYGGMVTGIILIIAKSVYSEYYNKELNESDKRR